MQPNAQLANRPPTRRGQPEIRVSALTPPPLESEFSLPRRDASDPAPTAVCEVSRGPYSPVNLGFRFSRNAVVPSCLSFDP